MSTQDETVGSIVPGSLDPNDITAHEAVLEELMTKIDESQETVDALREQIADTEVEISHLKNDILQLKKLKQKKTIECSYIGPEPEFDVSLLNPDHKDLINEIEIRRSEMLDFYRCIESGRIPLRVTHNDTKIANMLFDEEGNVLCMLDLDTVLKAPCLYDFGDSIRSYTNTGLEDDRDPDRVGMSMEMYEAFLRGYLSEAGSFLTDIERQYLPFSARYITYEQVLRFLMDYIDGDHYYKIKYPEHNLVRTRAQLRLLESIERQLL